MAKPEPGDTVFVGRREDGELLDVFRRRADGSMSEITPEVERVEVDDVSFTIHGRRPHPGVEGWHATAARDNESTDAMLRGVVQATESQGWALACRERVSANMTRYGLTRRERETAWLMLAGRSNAEIADALFITDQTVKNHLTSIGLRAGVSGRMMIAARLLDIEGIADA